MDLQSMYRKALEAKLRKANRAGNKGYFSNVLGTRIDGFRDVCKSIANLNKLYGELAEQEGIELKLTTISVPEEEEDKLLG